MNLFSQKTFLEVVVSILINLTSGWFGVLLVFPGLSSGITLNKYVLMSNLLFGILGLIVALILTERSNNYD